MQNPQPNGRLFIFWLFIFWLLGASAGRGQQPKEPDGRTQTLELNQPIEREIASGNTHTYTVTLKAGEFMQVQVEQKGVDIVLSLYMLDGKEFLKQDSPNGTQGTETITFVAEAAGLYRVTVEALEKNAKAGHV